MKLLEAYDELFSRFQPCFSRSDTFNRARDLSYAHLVTFGRHTISRMICSKNEHQKDWSADYKLFSNRKWEANDIFFEILKECDSHSHWYHNAIVIAMDEGAAWDFKQYKLFHGPFTDAAVGSQKLTIHYKNQMYRINFVKPGITQWFR